jgi:hypothetical protein
MVTKNPPYAELPQLSALYKIVADPHPPLPEGFSEVSGLGCFRTNFRMTKLQLLTVMN